MPTPKNNQTLHAQPSRAFLDRYGYTIKASSQRGVGVVYDRNGRKVSPAEYQRSVSDWNRRQQTVRQENQRRATQKEPYQAQSDAMRGRYQRGRNLTQKEVKRLQSQTENVMSGAVIAPSHILGAVGRKLADWDNRDFSELLWTGYDDKGVNAGYVTDEFARNHPELATIANFAGDVALGAAAGRFTGGEPGTRTAIDTYDYASPTLRLGTGEQPAGFLGTRSLPAVRGNSEVVPVETPLGIEGRRLPAVYSGSDIGPVRPNPSPRQQLSFSPNVTVRETSDVGFPRRQSAVGTRPPIDLEQTGTIYDVIPGNPLEFTPRFPWWAWPDYYEGSTPIHHSLGEVTIIDAPSKPKRSGNGHGKNRSNTRNGGTASALVEQAHPDYGPAIPEAMLNENRIPDYSPAVLSMQRGREWSPVVDMNGNTIISGNNMVGNEYDSYKYSHPEALHTVAPSQYGYAVNPGYSIRPYQNPDGSPLDMQAVIMNGVQVPEYAWGGPIFPLLF